MIFFDLNKEVKKELFSGLADWIIDSRSKVSAIKFRSSDMKGSLHSSVSNKLL